MTSFFNWNMDFYTSCFVELVSFVQIIIIVISKPYFFRALFNQLISFMMYWSMQVSSGKYISLPTTCKLYFYHLSIFETTQTQTFSAKKVEQKKH